MFVKLNEYLVQENEERTFVKMIKLEQKMNAAGCGLDSYHLFKDREAERKYWLVEYWISEDDYKLYQTLDSHKFFLELLKGVLERKHNQHFCDIVL
ncbi:MAG: antibiotic biosynthesis monooxygenase [Saprospiraceae bacterium]|nr:antibiotic biosynthesis monooxygenase [Saprospiraceae bacterium]